jgi:hypothetical protein
MNPFSVKTGSLLLVAAALGACAAMSPPAPPPPPPPPPPVRGAGECAGSQTPVVSISQLTVNNPTSATITVTPGQIPVGSTPSRVLWNYTGSGYAFVPNGIAFASYNSNPSSGPGARGRLGAANTSYFVCFGDTSSMPNATWSYSIQLQDQSNPGTVWTCDPTIVNDNMNGLPGNPQQVTCTLVGH